MNVNLDYKRVINKKILKLPYTLKSFKTFLIDFYHYSQIEIQILLQQCVDHKHSLYGNCLERL